MDKLLNWSIAQQSGDKEAIEKVGQPDPKMLNQLFGGPDEPALMKQSIAVITNDEASLEDKEVAFDNFEMLIENMDNANNIENLKLWPSILEQLTDDKPLSLRVYAASCFGTAVQNNPKAQEDAKKHEGILPLIHICGDSSTPPELLSKALLGISSFVRNFLPGYEQFREDNGWEIVNFPRDHDHKLSLRILSLISAILSNGLDDKSSAKIREDKIVEKFSDFLASDGHIGCIDKVLNITTQLSALHYEFSSREIALLASGIDRVGEILGQLDDYHSVKKIVS